MGIETAIQDGMSDPKNNKWVIKATVFKSVASKGFSGFGDADPSNIPTVMLGAEMRIAETRAVNRALRKAYGIGLCSVEELGAMSSTSAPADNLSSANGTGSHSRNVSKQLQPSLRDRLCVLIRQFDLDANLVKAYAADCCGVVALSEARRESVESFVSHLSVAARENREALICKLNSYTKPVAVNS